MSELTSNELNALVSLLYDSDSEVRNHVRYRILALGTDIIPFLEKKWENSFNPDIQKEIEELVHDLQFSLLKLRLSDWKNWEDRELLTGLWISNAYQYHYIGFDKLNEVTHHIYFEVWTAVSNDLQPFDQIRIINNM